MTLPDGFNYVGGEEMPKVICRADLRGCEFDHVCFDGFQLKESDLSYTIWRSCSARQAVIEKCGFVDSTLDKASAEIIVYCKENKMRIKQEDPCCLM